MRLAGLFLLLLAGARSTVADVFNMPAGQTSMVMVPVGNPGNMADTRFMDEGHGIYGTGNVGYEFNISKYEVTYGQYGQFLNSVARSDPHGLYSSNFDQRARFYDPNAWSIERNGVNGNYTYSVRSDWQNRPVENVSWLDALRFANWVTNGQPNGSQDSTTTEDGSYSLSSGFSNPNGFRRAGARYVVPSEDEWYKAAYFDPAKAGSSYWLYPTCSDTQPVNALDVTGTNNAWIDVNSYSLSVGSFPNSPSPWGTFDQVGNVTEWTETVFKHLDTLAYTGDRYVRGGGQSPGEASYHAHVSLSYEYFGVGFRLALVPEPGSGILLLIAAGCLTSRRRTRPNTAGTSVSGYASTW